MTTQHPLTDRISSIGWLHGVNRTIILTPCIDGQSHPTKVSISLQRFEEIRHSEELIREEAAKLLFLNRLAS